jgi:hypothetical protein
MLSCGPRELETRVVVGKTQSTRSRRLGVVGTSLVTCIPTQLRHLAHRRHLARRDTSSRQVSSPRPPGQTRLNQHDALPNLDISPIVGTWPEGIHRLDKSHLHLDKSHLHLDKSKQSPETIMYDHT